MVSESGKPIFKKEYKANQYFNNYYGTGILNLHKIFTLI
jgi:hypothetical protein